MAQAIQTMLMDLLASPRKQFGIDITLKPTTGHGILNISSMHPAYEGLATVIMKKPCDSSLIQTIQAFDIVLCNVDGTKKHVHMCGKDKEKEMLALEVQYLVNQSRGMWHEQEFERYQQRRVTMGLPRLQSAAQRSHWDEGMRLAYLEQFGGTAYQTQRVNDIADKRADFLKIDADALKEATSRREGMFVAISGDLLNSVTVTYLRFSDSVFTAVVLTLLHFFLLDCPLAGFKVTDASSGQAWAVDVDRPVPRLALLEPSVRCCNESFLPRHARRVAAQRRAFAGEAVHRLLAFGLSDAEVETVTRRFYSGRTFLQHVLESPDLCKNSTAFAYACRADVNGSCNASRPIFFVLVQVMMNLALEFHREPFDEPTAHIHEFFSGLWTASTQIAATCVENETYLCQGMTLVQYTDALQALMAATLDAHESAFLLKCGGGA